MRALQETSIHDKFIPLGRPFNRSHVCRLLSRPQCLCVTFSKRAQLAVYAVGKQPDRRRLRSFATDNSPNSRVRRLRII